MNHEFFAREFPAARVSDRALVVRGMASVRRTRGVREDGFRRWEVVCEIEQVEQVTAPIRELPATRFPKGAPTPWRQIFAVGEFGADRPAPQIPVQILRHGLRRRIAAPRIREIMPARDAARPHPRFY